MVFLPAFGIILFTGLDSRKHQIEAAVSSTTILLHSWAAQQEQVAVGTRQMLSTIALLPDVQNLDRDSCNELFRELREKNPSYATIAAVIPGGEVIASSPRVEPGSVNLSDRKHIRDAVRTLDFSAGEDIIGRISNEPGIAYAYPVLNPDRQIIAILLAGYRLNAYADFVNRANLPKGYVMTVLDHRGARLYRVPQESKPLGKPVPSDSFGAFSGELDHGIYEKVSEDGVRRMYAFKQLRLRKNEPPYLYLCIGIPKDAIVQKANFEMLKGLAFLGIAAFAAAFLAWLFGNYAFVTPLNRLVEATRRFGGGALGTRTGLPHTSDELGNLAESFDSMASLLETREIARKSAEESLALRESYLTAIIENVPGLVWLKDTNGSFLVTNHALARNFGRERPEDITGKIDVDLCPKELAEKYKADDEEVLTKGVPIAVEELISVLGQLKWFETYKAPVFNRKGQILGTVGYAREITERKMAEEVLRLTRFTVEHAADPIYWLSADDRIIYANEAACRSLGYSKEELTSMSLPDIDPLFSAERMREFYEQLKKAGSMVFETAHRRRDGSIFPIEVSAKHLVFGGRELNLNFVRDISERRQIERERHEMEAHLHQAQKLEAIGTLAGGIAHDFNNLLAPIIGYAELALGSIKPRNPAEHSLGQILTAALRARDLVKQILAFGRYGQEQLRKPVEISSIITEASKLMRASLPASIEIRQNLHEGAAMADATQIHQVFINLCTNAGHAMEDRGILEIDLSPVDLTENDLAASNIIDLKPGPFLRLNVSDNGCGIDAATMERIFDPYFTTKGVGKGSGLGLSVVHGIVKRHEGAITVRSRLNEGTTFSIFLPRLDLRALKPGAMSEHLPTGTERIMLVDDESVVIEIGTKMLERLGYSVVPKVDCLDALNTFRSKPNSFDLIITDYTMPNMTGIDFAGEILRIRSGMPIILCTGFSAQANEETAREAGIAGFTLKPLNVKQLAELVRNVLDSNGGAISDSRPPKNVEGLI